MTELVHESCAEQTPAFAGEVPNPFPPPRRGRCRRRRGSCSTKSYLVPAPAGPPQSLRDSSPCEGEQINQRPLFAGELPVG